MNRLEHRCCATTVNHACVLPVLQRAWRAHVKKRASKALAMMMLRAKVRRAHKAAYVSNLLRRKTGQTGGAAAPNGEHAEEQLPDDDVQLTAEVWPCYWRMSCLPVV